MKLIVETVDQNIEYLVEQTAQGKKYFVEGQWATADTPNRNGRIYPMSVMEGALAKYQNEFITQKRAMGELNHPSGPSINLDRVSHVIENLVMNGKAVVGRAKIMDTPMGKICQNLIDEGIKLGVSTRGLGSLIERNGIKQVQNDFFISAIDIVSDPSGPGCWINSINESVDYQVLEDGRIVEKVVELAVEQKKQRIDEAKAMQVFASFVNSLHENGYSPKNPKIDLHHKDGTYLASTNWSKTVKDAVKTYEAKNPKHAGMVKGYIAK